MNQFKEKVKQWLFLNLKKADMKISVQKYAENSLKYSILVSIFFWVFQSLLFEDLLTGFGASIVFFAINIGFWVYYPIMKKKRKADLIEKALPFALMNLSIELNIENRFEKALKNVSEKNNNELGKEVKIALTEISEGGVSVQEALFNLSSRIESEPLKRAVMKLITIYEQGGRKKNRGDAIRSIAKEELEIQKTKSKEFSHKLVLYSLMFIVVSAVFPALFQAFIIVGSTFMKLDFSPLQVILIVAVIFPLLDLACLIFIKSRTPMFLR